MYNFLNKNGFSSLINSFVAICHKIIVFFLQINKLNTFKWIIFMVLAKNVWISPK